MYLLPCLLFFDFIKVFQVFRFEIQEINWFAEYVETRSFSFMFNCLVKKKPEEL